MTLLRQGRAELVSLINPRAEFAMLVPRNFSFAAVWVSCGTRVVFFAVVSPNAENQCRLYRRYYCFDGPFTDGNPIRFPLSMDNATGNGVPVG